MTFSEDVYAKLQATSAITAIFSTRTHPLRLPEGSAVPALSYQTVGDDPEHTHGTGAGAYVLPMPRLLQIAVFDTDYKRCEASAKVVIAALVGRSDWNGSDTSVFLAGSREDVDPEPRGLYRWLVELTVRSPTL